MGTSGDKEHGNKARNTQEENVGVEWAELISQVVNKK